MCFCIIYKLLVIGDKKTWLLLSWKVFFLYCSLRPSHLHTLELWGRYMANHSLLFLTDNQAVVEVINKQSAKNSHLMRLIRRLVVAAMKFNVYFKAKHIPGKTSIIADKLSRFQDGIARQTAPWLQAQPAQIPAALQPWHQ